MVGTPGERQPNRGRQSARPRRQCPQRFQCRHLNHRVGAEIAHVLVANEYRNMNMKSEDSFSPPISRRDFLKTSTVAASAAAIGTLDLSRSAHAAGSDIIKVGMIGCGDRNAGAASQALTADPGARLVAMCDIFRDRVENKLGEIKAAKGAQVTVDDAHKFTGFDGYKHVIEASDMVCIANAAKFHPFHAMAAIQAGKHVFVEKQ